MFAPSQLMSLVPKGGQSPTGSVPPAEDIFGQLVSAGRRSRVVEKTRLTGSTRKGTQNGQNIDLVTTLGRVIVSRQARKRQKEVKTWHH
jgi:hypothetical protein